MGIIELIKRKRKEALMSRLKKAEAKMEADKKEDAEMKEYLERKAKVDEYNKTRTSGSKAKIKKVLDALKNEMKLTAEATKKNSPLFANEGKNGPQPLFGRDLLADETKTNMPMFGKDVLASEPKPKKKKDDDKNMFMGGGQW